jgi:16S rRNA G1207 methylase RsmC
MGRFDEREKSARARARDEQPAPGEIWDLVYGADAGGVPTTRLLVDWDARRLASAGAVAVRCAELADLAAEGRRSLLRVCLNVFPFTAKVQWRRDLAAAGWLLVAGGELAVRVHDRRLMPEIGRVLAAEFASVERRGGSWYHARGPRRRSHHPPADPVTVITHPDPVSGRVLVLGSVPGLFAHGAIDAGSGLLLDVVGARWPDLWGRSVLDVGCGYGALGCTLASRGAVVTMVDSDWRAVKLARRNLAVNQLRGEVLVGDAAATLPAGPFDLALSNPPTHAGSEVLRPLFELAAAAAPALLLVLREHLHYEKWLTARHQVTTLAVRHGYKVLQVVAAS